MPEDTPEEVQRYFVKHSWPHVGRDPKGAWMRFEDHHRIVSSLRERLKEVERERDEWRGKEMAARERRRNADCHRHHAETSLAIEKETAANVEAALKQRVELAEQRAEAADREAATMRQFHEQAEQRADSLEREAKRQKEAADQECTRADAAERERDDAEQRAEKAEEHADSLEKERDFYREKRKESADRNSELRLRLVKAEKTAREGAPVGAQGLGHAADAQPGSGESAAQIVTEERELGGGVASAEVQCEDCLRADQDRNPERYGLPSPSVGAGVPSSGSEKCPDCGKENCPYLMPDIDALERAASDIAAFEGIGMREWAELLLALDAGGWILHRARPTQHPRGEGEQEAIDVVADFLAHWRYCPVSSAESPARSCLEDAARQLLAALPTLHAASTPSEPHPLRDEGEQDG